MFDNRSYLLLIKNRNKDKILKVDHSGISKLMIPYAAKCMQVTLDAILK